MSALDTVEHVLTWAIAPHGPPPQGDLRDADALLRAPAALLARMAELVAVTAARLRFAATSRFAGAVNRASLLLAAAVGVLGSPLSRELLAALPPPRPADWIGRHALVGPVVLQVCPRKATADRAAQDIAAELLAMSPLSLVWFRPPPGNEAAAMPVIERLVAEPDARRAAILQLAEPSDRPDVGAFRADLLDRLRLHSPASSELVIDIYEAMMIHHRDRALDQVRRARAILLDRAAIADDDRLQDALSVAAVWAPLASIDATTGAALRERRHLGYDYREGLTLARLAQRLKGQV